MVLYNICLMSGLQWYQITGCVQHRFIQCRMFYTCKKDSELIFITSPHLIQSIQNKWTMAFLALVQYRVAFYYSAFVWTFYRVNQDKFTLNTHINVCALIITSSIMLVAHPERCNTGKATSLKIANRKRDIITPVWICIIICTKCWRLISSVLRQLLKFQGCGLSNFKIKISSVLVSILQDIL